MSTTLVKPKPRAAASRQEAPDALKMAHLIEAAENIFLAKGYHTATMSDVAKAAGMSKKTVYQLIESKSELFLALLYHNQAKFNFPAKVEGLSTKEILIQNLLCLAQFLFSPEQIAIVRLIMAEYTHSTDFGRIFHQKRLIKIKMQLENSLVKIAERDGMKLSDTREMAAMLFGMAIGEFHMGILIGFRPKPTKTVLERRIRHAVEVFMTGYTCAPLPKRA